jgi:flagellar motility protein MotE (MotC chaperone)
MAPRRPRKRGRVLPLLAGMLIASGLIRAGLGAGHAIAEEAAAVAPPPEDAPQGEAEVCLPEEDTGALIEAFRTREARLVEREAALADRIQALNVAETEISEKLVALQEAEASLAATLALAESAAEDDLSRLTLVYENMKPADAAALFETMDAAFAAGFLGRMAPEAAAAVMTDLAPETAYLISAILAGRNAMAPTE